MENDWKVGKVYYTREERPEEGRVNALRSGPLRKKIFKEDFKDTCFVICEMTHFIFPQKLL